MNNFLFFKTELIKVFEQYLVKYDLTVWQLAQYN